MDYYIDLVRVGDGTFVLGPFRTPPTIHSSEVYVDNDALPLRRDRDGWWRLLDGFTTTPEDTTERGELGPIYNYFQIRVQVAEPEAEELQPDYYLEFWQNESISCRYGFKVPDEDQARVLRMSADEVHAYIHDHTDMWVLEKEEMISTDGLVGKVTCEADSSLHHVEWDMDEADDLTNPDLEDALEMEDLSDAVAERNLAHFGALVLGILEHALGERTPCTGAAKTADAAIRAADKIMALAFSARLARAEGMDLFMPCPPYTQLVRNAEAKHDSHDAG